MELNDKQRIFIDNKLYNLNKSKFRSSFKLTKKMKEYVKNNGYEVIESHAFDLIRKRLVPKVILNDGRQTPMRGHPVFIAQHATGWCCRGLRECGWCGCKHGFCEPSAAGVRPERHNCQKCCALQGRERRFYFQSAAEKGSKVGAQGVPAMCRLSACS